MERILMLVMRIGVAMCFIGHGAFGLLQKRDWLAFFERFGIPEDAAMLVMPLVGSLDIAIGVAALLVPVRALFIYAAAWCVFTAALRPMTGLGVAEALERAGNYGVPLAVLACTAGTAWFRRIPGAIPAARRGAVFQVSAWTTATLLAGHGWLAIQSKPLLVQHLSLIGVRHEMVPLFGGGEVLLAVLCIARPTVGIFVAAAVWKIATESLFIAAGAPLWEFIERSGSYVAPLVAASLASTQAATAVGRLARVRAAVTAAILVAAFVPLGAQIAAPQKGLTPEMLATLRVGGLVVACRHAITSHDQEDRMPVNFDDASTQRVLSPAGEAQATALGKSIETLSIPFGPVLASPFQRTRRTAELMIGRAEVDHALSSAARGKDAELRALMSGAVPAGANRLLITHQGLLYRSFPSLPRGSIAEGDCLVVQPGDPVGEVLATVKPAQWIR
jgi:phosphohistidine phosphatase SixA